jgi:glycosyltransferase involved in cell wall biosynthesis
VSPIKLAVIMSGFPRRSETFAINELLALARRDMLAAIVATKPGDTGRSQPDVDRLLPFLAGTAGPPIQSTLTQLTNFALDCLSDKHISGVHAYFAHEPAAVAERIAAELGVPFSFSVHAKDARKVSASELTRRASNAACVIACNADTANAIRSKSSLIPHGVDLHRFQFRAQPPASPLQLLAAGRLVEKKGFHYLLAAVARVKFDFQLRIYGEGPERSRLEQAIAAYRLHDRVELCGPTTHAALPAAYSSAHVVVAPSVLDGTGDRDGLPNVILEAMACGRAVVASDVGAIGVAVQPGKTGILIPPADPESLAQALTELATNSTYRAELGSAARNYVAENYDVDQCSGRFCQLLESTYARVSPASYALSF